MSLNGGQDRGEHGRDCGGGAGMVRLCGVPCGSRGKREGMCRKREGRAGSMGRVGKGEERVGGCGTEVSLKELTGRRHMPQPSVFKGVQACRLPTLKPFSNPSAGLSPSQPHAPAICF